MPVGARQLVDVAAANLPAELFNQNGLLRSGNNPQRAGDLMTLSPARLTV